MFLLGFFLRAFPPSAKENKGWVAVEILARALKNWWRLEPIKQGKENLERIKELLHNWRLHTELTLTNNLPRWFTVKWEELQAAFGADEQKVWIGRVSDRLNELIGLSTILVFFLFLVH